MKKAILLLLVSVCCSLPSLAAAKGVPLFFNTGDELFEIDGAPTLEKGYSIGYACKRFGIFGADLWTWDCELTAVNLDKFSVTDIPDQLLADVTGKYKESDRKRNVWNHYGALIVALALAGFGLFSMLKKD